MGLPWIQSRWYEPLYTPCRESTELTNDRTKRPWASLRYSTDKTNDLASWLSGGHNFA